MATAILAKTSSRKFEISEAQLRSLYVEQQLQLKDIAEKLKCSTQTVFNRLAEYGIKSDRILPRITKRCVDCGNDFTTFASTGNQRVRCDNCKGNNRWGIKGSHSIVPCAECGKLLHRAKCRVEKVERSFCDAKCAGAWQSKNKSAENHPQWNGGKQAKYARVEADPQKRLRRRISNQIWQSLKQAKNGKRWESLVGYTVDDLKSHLERQFRAGMSWENYGEWHIDHIVPVSAFSFQSPEDKEFKECFALSNLRPLPGTENIMKSDSRIFLL